MNEIEFWRLQKECGLSNSKCAEYLGTSISTIKRYRNGSKSPAISIIRDLQALSEKLNK